MWNYMVSHLETQEWLKKHGWIDSEMVKYSIDSGMDTDNTNTDMSREATNLYTTQQIIPHNTALPEIQHFIMSIPSAWCCLVT